MTMTEIRKEFKEKAAERRAMKKWTVSEDIKAAHIEMCEREAQRVESLAKQIEAIWANGAIADYDVSNDLLKLANGFKTISESTAFHVNWVFDLRSIVIDDKKTVKAFAEMVLQSL